jgi:hypothetical protein
MFNFIQNKIDGTGEVLPSLDRNSYRVILSISLFALDCFRLYSSDLNSTIYVSYRVSGRWGLKSCTINCP